MYICFCYQSCVFHQVWYFLETPLYINLEVLSECFQECLTVVSDSNGTLVPMVRDALGGFREPRYCSLPNIHSYAVCTKPIEGTESGSGTGPAEDGNITLLQHYAM